MTANIISIPPRAFEGGNVPTFFREPNDVQEPGANLSLTETAVSGQLTSVDSWSDAELVEAVRGETPNEAALDILVARYWGSLFARCQMLTLNRENALDLAQATWYRLLRNRQALRPDGNFPGYLVTIATNLFRDSCRAARRAGPMAESRLESLDAARSNDDGKMVSLADIVTDTKSLRAEEQTLLAIDLDRALGQLSPQMREVLVARFIDGESCAEIGLRFGRTEQTVSGWIRKALRQMKALLEKPGRFQNCRDEEVIA